MKKQSSLKRKLILMGVAISVISLAMGASNFYGLRKVSESYSHVASVNLPNTQYLAKMYSEYRAVRIHLRTLGIDGISQEIAKASIDGAVKSIQNYEEAEKKYSEVPFAAGEEVIFNRLNAAWVVFKAVGARVISNYQTGGKEGLAQNKIIFFKDCPEAADIFNGEIESLLKFQNEQSAKWVERARADSQFANLFGLGLIFGQMIFSLLFAIFMGNSLNRVFSEMVKKLSGEADEVGHAARRIAETSAELSSATSEQAAALQETASAIAEVSAMVSKNAENAARSTEISRQSTQQTTRGKEAVHQMIQSIGNIDQANEQIMQQIDHSNRQMTEFVTLIHEIAEKTKVINDIVFQTKLLSFNASVEAARAGEHGKGFAVVAEEVGNLAQMSGNASREISGMLLTSSQRVESVAKETREKVEGLMSEAKAKVKQGMLVSNECSETFEEIVNSVQEVSRMVNEIALGSKEQSQGVAEIMKAIHQMDQVTQQNSAASQSAADDATQLGTEAEKMRAIVGELTVVVQGGVMPDSFGESASHAVTVFEKKPSAQAA